jgi:hypothetical protein
MSDPRYTSIDRVKAKGVTDTDDNILDSILRAEEWIDTITRRYFVPTEITFDQDGTGHNEIQTEYYPIQSITALSFEYGLWGPTRTINLTPPVGTFCDVIIKAEEGVIVNRRQVWPAGENNVHITGIFGEPSCPLMIIEAATLLAMAGGGPSAIPLRGSRVRAVNQTMQGETIGSYSYTRKTTQTPLGVQSTGVDEVDRILWQFRREPFLRAVGHRHDYSPREDEVLRRVVGDG